MMSAKSVVPPASFDELVQQLHVIFASDKVDVDYVQTLMASYKSKREEWERFVNWDEHKYTRNLVDEGNEKFNLIVLCWNKSQGTSVHDHSDAHCFMKILEGQINETLFDWPKEEGEPLIERQTRHHQTDECAYMCDDIGLHQVTNPNPEAGSVSLHLYSPPFGQCAAFDKENGNKTISKMLFYSKAGKKMPMEVI